jgi:hypothetical protein
MDSGGDGNTGQHASTQNSILTHSSSQNQRMNNQGGGSKKGKQRQDDVGSDDEGEYPSDPGPLPPSFPPTKEEIIHRADITLRVLINNEDKCHLLRVITKAKVCCCIWSLLYTI